MNRKRRLIMLLVTLLPVAVFFIAASVYVYVQVASLTNRLDVLVVDQLEQTYGREVRVGKVTTKPLGIAVIEDFAISEGKSFKSGTLLQSKRVEIKYDWMGLLLGRRHPAQVVSSVSLYSPTAHLVRFKSGRWNFSDFLVRKPGKKPGPPFTGKVFIHDGKVSLRDYQAKIPGVKAADNQVSGLEGLFDAASAPYYRFEAAGIGVRGRVGQLAASGTIHTKRGIWQIDLTALDAAASYWPNYFMNTGAVKLTRGTADMSMSFSREGVGKQVKWDYTGSADLRNVSASISQLNQNASSVNGKVRFSNDLAAGNLVGRLAQSDVSIRGSVVNFKKPRVDLRVSSPSADFGAIWKSLADKGITGLRLAGRGPVSARVIGPMEELSVTASARVPTAYVAGNKVSDITATASYADNVLRIPELMASALGGRVEGSGVVELGRQTLLNLRGRASSINIAELPIPAKVSISGRASGTFSVTGTAKAPVLNANVKVNAGKFDKVAFSSLSTNLSVQGNRVDIQQANLALMGGTLKGKGSITSRALDLSITARSINLQQASVLMGQKGLSGTLFFSGQITGPPSNPVAVGSGEVFEGKMSGYEFDYARGRLTASAGGINLDQAIVRVFPGEAVVTGTITRTAGRPLLLDLSADIKRTQASQIMKMLGSTANVTGTLHGQLNIKGPVPEVTVKGSVYLDDGMVAGIPVSTASADIDYSNGILSVTEATANSDSAVFTANGTMSSTGTLDFTFGLVNLSMARLNPYVHPYVDITGTLEKISGRVTGTSKSPDVSLEANASSITINDQPFDSLSVGASWIDDVVAISTAKLERGELSYVLNNTSYDTRTQVLQASGEFTKISADQLLGVIYRSPYLQTDESGKLREMLAQIPRPLTGIGSLTFKANGPIDKLDASVSGTLSDFTAGPVNVEKVETDISLQDGTVTVDSFSAMAKDLNINLKPGVVYQDGSLNLDLTVSNIDASILSPYIRPTSLSGTATVDALITGAPRMPDITASVDIENPVLNGIAFDRIRTSPIRVSRENIQFDRIILSEGTHQMELKGNLPWSWEDFSIPQDRPLELQAELRNQSMAIFSAFTNAVKAEGTSGTVNASLSVTGTLEQPVTRGQFSVADGTIVFRNTDASLKDIQASLVFNGERVVIDNFTATSSMGGTISAEPGGWISLQEFPEGSVNVALTARDFKFSEKNLSGYNESVAATLQSDVKITGSLDSPLITGNVSLSSGNIVIPPVLPTAQGKPKKYSIDPTFDVKVVFGKDMWFRNPRVVALMEQKDSYISVKGSLASPNIDGRVVVSEGYIRLPTARLRLVKGGTVDFTYAPSAEGSAGSGVVSATINVEGKTTVTALSSAGARRQYQISMLIRGPVDNMNVILKSSPSDLSQNRILALLGHVEDIFTPGDVALKEDLSQVFTALAGGAVLGPFENAVTEALGLQEFRVVGGINDPVAVFASREVFPDFSVSYYRSLNALEEDYFLRLSYQIKENYAIGITKDDRNVSTLDANFTFRF